MMLALVDNSGTQFDRQYTTIPCVLSGTGRWENVRYGSSVCPHFIPPNWEDATDSDYSYIMVVGGSVLLVLSLFMLSLSHEQQFYQVNCRLWFSVLTHTEPLSYPGVPRTRIRSRPRQWHNIYPQLRYHPTVLLPSARTRDGHRVFSKSSAE